MKGGVVAERDRDNILIYFVTSCADPPFVISAISAHVRAVGVTFLRIYALLLLLLPMMFCKRISRFGCCLNYLRILSSSVKFDLNPTQFRFQYFTIS